MAILLTNPEVYPAAHGQPEEEYTQVIITKFDLRIIERMVAFTMQYGNMVGNVWIAGKLPVGKIVVRDMPAVMGSGVDPEDGVFKVLEVEPANPAFTIMAGQLLVEASHVGYPFLHALGADLYQYFIDAGYYEGIVIP